MTPGEIRFTFCQSLILRAQMCIRLYIRHANIVYLRVDDLGVRQRHDMHTCIVPFISHLHRPIHLTRSIGMLSTKQQKRHSSHTEHEGSGWYVRSTDRADVFLSLLRCVRHLRSRPCSCPPR